MRLLGIGLCLLVAGCFGPITLEDSSAIRAIDVPGDTALHMASVGDVLVAQGTKTIVSAIKISALTTFGKSEGESAGFFCGLTFQAGIIPLRGSVASMGRTGECYGPARGSHTDGDGLTSTMGCDGAVAEMDICQDIADDTFFVYYPNYNKSAVIPLEQDFYNISKTGMLVPNVSNFLREIMFTGVVEDHMNFRYREFSGELNSPSFEKDLQIQVKNLPIRLKYRGFELEITLASDTEIEYRSISGGQH